MTLIVFFLFVGIGGGLAADPNWANLFQGQVQVNGTKLQGDLMGTTFAGYRAFVYPGIKYASARRFEVHCPS